MVTDMRKMKDSGISWIGEVPAEWNIYPLKYSFEFIAGATPDSTNADLWDGDVSWITPADYKTKDVYVSGGSRNLSDLGYKSCSTHMLPIGTVVVSKRAPIGSVAIATKPLCTNQGCLGLVWKYDNINEKYYYYALSIYDDVLNLYGSGTTFKEISANVFSSIKVVNPPYQQQQAIVAFLDSKCTEIDALFADIQSEIDTLEAYKRSKVFDTVMHGIDQDDFTQTDSDVWSTIPAGWKLVDIKYIFEIVKRIAGKEGFDVIAITQQGLKYKDISSNEGQLASDYSGYQFVYPGDYAMNHMDLLTGWVDLSDKFGVTSPDYRVFRLRHPDVYDRKYYKYIMQCCYMNRIFYSLGQGVSNLGRWRLQTSAFNNFKVPVPPYEEQVKIGEFLDAEISEINGIISQKQEQLAVLTDYKKSVIYEYVTGKKEVPVA